MTMNVEALKIIELDAARAPAPMVDHYIELVRSSIRDCADDVAEYAAALLLKLEHLASSQRAAPVDTSLPQVFLAPWLELTPASLKDAAWSSPARAREHRGAADCPSQRIPCDRHGSDLHRSRIERVLRTCVFINPSGALCPRSGQRRLLAQQERNRRMATRKTKHPPKAEQRRRLTLFFNKEARKSAADALKKASWLLAAANTYLGFAKESMAYLAVVIVGWLVAHTLAVILLSLEEEQGSQGPEEQAHARPPGIGGKRTQP